MYNTMNKIQFKESTSSAFKAIINDPKFKEATAPLDFTGYLVNHKHCIGVSTSDFSEEQQARLRSYCSVRQLTFSIMTDPRQPQNQFIKVFPDVMDWKPGIIKALAQTPKKGTRK